MAVFRIKNFIPNQTTSAKTYLSQSVNAGDTSLPVQNVSGMNDAKYKQLGETGNEGSEIVLCSGVGATTLTVGALALAHNANAPVYEVRYNQIRIYRNRSASVTLIATINIQVGSPYTLYEDTGSQTGDTYASALYNSHTGDEAPQGNFAALTGYASNTFIAMLKAAQALFKNTNNRVSDDQWKSFVNLAYAQLYLEIIRMDESYNLVGPLTISGSDLADGSGTEFVLPSTSRIMKWFYVSFDGTRFVRPQRQDMQNFDPNDSFSQEYPKFSFTGTSMIIRPAGCRTLKYFHYPAVTELVSEGDTPIFPLNSYPLAIIYGALRLAFGGEKNETWKREYQADFNEQRGLLQGEISDRQLMEYGGVQVDDDRHLQVILGEL